VESMTDEYWRLRPEHVDAVRERTPELVYTFTGENGRTRTHAGEHSFHSADRAQRPARRGATQSKGPPRLTDPSQLGRARISGTGL
jgi:hypothetical protein